MINSLLSVVAGYRRNAMPTRSGTGWRDAPPVDRVGIRLVSRRSAGAGSPLRARLGVRLAGQRNLQPAPALGLPALPVVRFTDPAADEVGFGHTAAPGSYSAASVSRPIGRLPGSTTTCTATPTSGPRRDESRPNCSRPTRAAGSSTARSARCSRLRAARAPLSEVQPRNHGRGTLPPTIGKMRQRAAECELSGVEF